MTNSRDQGIDRLITNNLHRLSKYGALTARPGYEIAGHQLTGGRAIVATVHTKTPLASLTRGQALSDNIGGVAGDVREPRSYQRLRAIDPLAAKVSQTYRRPEYAEPTWPLERELPCGKLLKSARSETRKRLQNLSPTGISENRDAGLILESKEIVQYFGPIFDADWRGSRPLVVASRPHQSGAKRRRRPTAKQTKNGGPAAAKMTISKHAELAVAGRGDDKTAQ